MDGTAKDYRLEDNLWPFVLRSRTAFAKASGEPLSKWEPDTRKPIVEGVTIRRITVTLEDEPFTVAEVTQPVGVVIPPHRHHESHVLLQVVQGAIQVDCEGYSRRVEGGTECIIPQGFTHTVFALADLTTGDSKPAIYRSAHFEEWLTADDNRFLKHWPTRPGSQELMTELEVATNLIRWFLALQPEYLKNHENYRAWFYVMHTDPESKIPNVDQVGFTGRWEDHVETAHRVINMWAAAPSFRLGTLLSDKRWGTLPVYAPIFCAHQIKAKAEEVSEFYAFKADPNDEKWVLTHKCEAVNELLKKYEGTFQEYIWLLTREFLTPTEYLVYVTPPQQANLNGFLEQTRRQPFSSFIVGITHGSREFIEALFNFFLTCSSIIQQMRFAVRADITSIRYQDKRRSEFFVERLLPLLDEIR